MTREEHIYQLIQYLQGRLISMCPASSLYWKEHYEEIIKGLEQEPTKNDDCISKKYIYSRIKGMDHYEESEGSEGDGTLITYNTCDWNEVLREIEDAPSVTPQPTKNDLGADCIDRQIISDYVESHILENNTGYGDLNRHTNSILRMIVDYIENMPSLALQEPTDKNFTKADIDAIVKAINAHWELTIDEIRAEIKKLQKMCDKNDLNLMAQYSAFGMVLDILDKYKGESDST
jgi:hypothetical protein